MPRTKEVFQHIRDSSKQNILDKAAEVFASKGLANTKVSDLVKAAGISQGLLYWYFSDKDDVFIALLEQAVNGVIDYAQTAVKYIGTPREKLYWLTEKVLQGMLENPAYFQLVSQALALPGKVRDTIWKLEKVRKIIRELITEGQTIGEIDKRNPDRLVFLYLSCLYGLAAGKGFNVPRLDEYFPTTEEVLQLLKA
jgi:AcrR family transcriptional regulator